MKQTMVRYKVKAGRTAENEQYIARVFAQLERERPAGVRYASLKLEDGVSFVHIAWHEAVDGHSPLTELSAFKEFVAGVRERCEEAPIAAEFSEIGSYGLLGDGRHT